MNYEQYYPTPPEIGERLAKMIELPQLPILEPSAGTGNLIQAFQKAHKYSHWDSRYSTNDFHCVEINPDRAATLKGNDFIVIWNDFLTFNPLMPYRTIIMNPPFHDGATHLYHALKILADGGKIACILNAETIRNPYTNERKALIQELETAEDYQVEYVQSAFADTDVEVALIHVKKKAATIKCATFENFKKSVVAEREQSDPQSLIRHGEVNALIDLYRAEVKTALALYDEMLNYNALTCGRDGYDRLFEIKLRSHGEGHSGIVKAVNYRYWYQLLHSQELDRLLTNDAQRDYSSKLREMEEYEFNERNILQLKADLTANLFGSIDAAIMKVWHNFTDRFALAEYSKNIHYYNGWKTNKAFKCNKKVIIPLYAFDTFGKEFRASKVQGQLSDIEKAMNYLDCGRMDGDSHSEQWEDMTTCLQRAQEQGFTKLMTKHFSVALYKKGTCHLTFKDETLLKKFNLYCGRKLNWLPDGYGFKAYSDLDDEERAVADSFEGRDSYEETYRNRQFYLQSNSSPLLLTASRP